MRLLLPFTAALAAFSLTQGAALLAQQRKAETRLVNGNVEARIVDPAGVDHYFVFQGVGIGGPVEIPATQANCASPVFFTIGPLAGHNHQHTVDWLDCNNTRHRWQIAIPVSSQWLSGSVLPIKSPYGFGCGTNAPVGLDLDDEPALGTARTFMVSDLPASTVFATTSLAFDRVPGWGYPLTNLGLPSPECYVFIDLSSAIGLGIATPSSNTATLPFTVPSDPAITGLEVFAQAAALCPGENPAGIVTSNGLRLLLAP